ncbi:MAG: hypothetical protein SFY95_05150 [Planctomycetota bacterium]|nr:hypothetical protein [Planctomycetota bacterium]
MSGTITDQALAFLQQHQPLPPTAEMSAALLDRFEEVRQHFVDAPDERAIPLLLGALSQGDGHGVFQLVEDCLQQHPKHVVVPHLAAVLREGRPEARYWAATFATGFPHADLVKPLGELVRTGDSECSTAAIMALDLNDSEEAQALVSQLAAADPEVAAILAELRDTEA